MHVYPFGSIATVTYEAAIRRSNADHESMLTRAYHAGYAYGEVLRECGAEYVTLPDNVVKVCEDGATYQSYFSTYDYEACEYAALRGVADGIGGHDALSNAQINIHFD